MIRFIAAMCAGLALVSSLAHADDSAPSASGAPSAAAVHETLDRSGIANTFEVYDGDHGSGVV